MEGAMSLGIPRNPDYNGAIQEGVSYCQRTIENGLRMSAAKAFLHPARKRGNVDVRTHAHVTNLIFEGKRAVGVRYLKGGKGGSPVEVRASKEVILCGGTYNSPQVLQLSGVGSPELPGGGGVSFFFVDIYFSCCFGGLIKTVRPAHPPPVLMPERQQAH